MRVAFIGLGNMGSPMALNILRAGHQLTVFNRTIEKAQPLADAGAKVVSSAVEAVGDCEVLMTMVANDAALEDSLLRSPSGGNAAIDVLPKNAVHMSCSTISVECSKVFAEEHARRGQYYLGTTVLGRPAAAAEKKLWVIVAGENSVLQR
jgi:3-hydroxyisobutyrate dehydrogenase-like beta-hydroxyacid dehydrogenase